MRYLYFHIVVQQNVCTNIFIKFTSKCIREREKMTFRCCLAITRQRITAKPKLSSYIIFLMHLMLTFLVKN